MPLRLIQFSGDREKVFEFEKDLISLGRASENDIQIEDINSSRQHCRIKKAVSGYYLEDVGSRNGTFVNGTLVSRHCLQKGDKIEIGQTTFYFQSRKNIEAEETARMPAIMDFPEEEEAYSPPYTKPSIEAKPEELQKEIQDLYNLFQINSKLGLEENFPSLMELIMDSAIQVSGAERGFLIFKEEDSLEVKCSRNMDKEFIKKAKLKISKSIVEEVLFSGKAILTNDAQNDERFTGVFSIHGLKLRSVLCMPLKMGQEARGVLYLDNRFEKGVFNRHHLQLLQSFADQCSVAFKMVKLSEEKELLRKEIQELRQEIEGLRKVAEEEKEKQKLRLQMLESRGDKDTTRKIKKPSFKYEYSNIVTSSPKMYEIFKILDKVVDSNVPVLIQGESGTGKELIARALHFNSKRKNNPFVSENCAAIPQNLMESEFFGYEKGAFTGADKRKIGLFEVANSSTLFLDEIAEMSSDMQTKFLRVIQEGEVRRVGGKDIVHVDVRVVSACNKDLAAEVKKNRFREDLFYRLNVITIDLPPLRKRKEDIPYLIQFFLEKNSTKSGGMKRELSSETLELLLEYDWPGNIRELENEIERAIALSKDIITPDYLSEAILTGVGKGSSSSQIPSTSAGGQTLKDILQEEVEKVEKKAILKTLQDTQWKKAQAAEILGISRPTLDSKIEKYKIRREM